MSRMFLYPGIITSQNDRQRHYISSHELARLYNINIHLCTIINTSKNHSLRGLTKTKDDIHLYPRYNGKYENFKEKQNEMFLSRCRL